MTEELTVLVSPPEWATSVVPPLGLIELAAYLEMQGNSVKIVDIKRSLFQVNSPGLVEGVIREIVDRLEKEKPSYVGLSCFTMGYWVCTSLAQRIKERIRTTLIIGGIHATVCPEDFMYDDSPFDIVVIGEGEETLYV